MGEGKGGMFQENSIETCILSRVKQITSPGWMHETSTRTWCTGKAQRDRVEREVGGGIGMGNTCKPMAVSFQCMTKSTTNKKKKRHRKVAKIIQSSQRYPTKVLPLLTSYCPVMHWSQLRNQHRVRAMSLQSCPPLFTSL